MDNRKRTMFEAATKAILLWEKHKDEFKANAGKALGTPIKATDNELMLAYAAGVRDAQEKVCI